MGYSYELASRGNRLGAAILDRCFFFFTLVPLRFAEGMAGPKDAPFSMEELGLYLASAFLFVGLYVVQCCLLLTRGQTLGKRMVKIKVISNTRRPARFVRLVLIRTILIDLVIVIPDLVFALPILGTLFYWADSLCIFGEDRRCLHDLLAKTIVVQSWD